MTFSLFLKSDAIIRPVRKIQISKTLRPRLSACFILIALLLSVVPSAGLASRPPSGAVPVSKIIIRTTGGVSCAFRNGTWTVGVRVNRNWFVSFRQQAKNYAKQARKSQGANRANLERMAGSAALKALRQQPRCSRLKPPVTALPPANTPTLPVNTAYTEAPNTSLNNATTTTTIDPDNLVFPDACPTQIESGWAVRNGVGAGELVQALACGESSPMIATGAPIKVAVLNPEAPAANFPEFFAGIEAGAKYINERLGGVGADYETLTPGRPIELTKCAYDVVRPGSLDSCAALVVAGAPDIVLTTLTWSSSHRPILRSAGLKELVALPIMPDDFSAESVRSMSGTPCIPVNVGLVDYASRVLKAASLSLVYGRNPISLLCYDIGTVTAANVLTGMTSGSDQRRGSLPALSQTGVSQPTGLADVSDVVTALQSSGAEVYAINNRGSECTQILNKLAERGWTNSSRQILLSGACFDPTALGALGAVAEGVMFFGGEEMTPESERRTLLAQELELRLKYLNRYVSNQSYVDLEFTRAGFDFAMRFWQAAKVAVTQGPFTADAVFSALDSFDNHVAFGGGRMSCAEPPYASTCSHYLKAYRWQSGKLQSTSELFSGMDLLAGTPIYDAGRPPERRTLN